MSHESEWYTPSIPFLSVIKPEDAPRQVRASLTQLRNARQVFCAGLLHGKDALSLIQDCESGIRDLQMLRRELALRVEQTGAYEATGHTTSSEWFSEVTGDTLRNATRVLQAAGTLDAFPDVAEAVVNSSLSEAQAVELAEAAAAAPDRTAELVEVATSDAKTLRQVRDRCNRVKREALSEEDLIQREERIHRERSARTYVDSEGAYCLRARLTALAGARLEASLESRVEELFKQAREEGRHEPVDAYRADALVELVCSGRVHLGDRGPSSYARATLVVSPEALKRGSANPGDTCELRGAGQISVHTAREVLGDSLFDILVRDAVDVYAFTSQTRSMDSRARAALEFRDESCVVPGCAVRSGLENHHYLVDFRENGPTELANLCRVCAKHHDLCSYGKWKIRGGPGRWRFVPPGESAPIDPDSFTKASSDARKQKQPRNRNRKPPPGLAASLFGVESGSFATGSG